MLAATSDLFEQDYRAVIADGSSRWIHDRTVRIRDAAGKTVAFRGTLIDITERKAAAVEACTALFEQHGFEVPKPT